MAEQKRSNDNDLIDEAEELPTPSHQGTAGGDINRTIGARDEERAATGGEPEPTSVQKRDKPAEGDMPNPPERRQ